MLHKVLSAFLEVCLTHVQTSDERDGRVLTYLWNIRRDARQGALACTINHPVRFAYFLTLNLS
jgi:hypothetical protein